MIIMNDSDNDNDNDNDSVYGAFIIAKPLQEFTRFIWWIRNSAELLLTVGQVCLCNMLVTASTIDISLLLSLSVDLV